jgi:hypothetical protein
MQTPSGDALGKRPKELDRRCEPQASPLRNGRREVFSVVREKPIGAACDGGQQHCNIRRMTN